jgi:hypothetical protein
MFVPAGAAFREGETFSRVAIGVQPVAGQFGFLLDTNLSDPGAPGSSQQIPIGTGTCTIDLLEKLSDGSFVAHYTFTISNGAGGTISGGGIGTWK